MKLEDALRNFRASDPMKNASNLGMVNNYDESEDNLDILGDFKWIIILIIDIKIIFFQIDTSNCF